MLLALPPVDRLKMAGRMFSDSRALVRAGIVHERPQISENELRIELFQRLYGHDFTELEQESIIKTLTQTKSPL